MISSVCAQNPQTAIWTDRVEYSPSDTGTLFLAYYNDRGRTLAIEDMVVIFESWRGYTTSGGWEGNQTIEVSEAVVSQGVFYTSLKFTVPTDGRANSTIVRLIIETTELGPIEASGFVNVQYVPRYFEQIVMWLMLIVVMILIGIVIVAATMYLSLRRPRTALTQTG
jgi:hypothetical protein